MRILAVSDSRSRQGSLVDHLHELGYPKVFAVSSAEEAKKAYKLERPAVVIIDIFLPGTSATDLLRNLGHPPDKTIIISHTDVNDFSQKLAGMGLPKATDKVKTPVYTSHPITSKKLKQAMDEVQAKE